jgi:GNAT superfamily N-acetyltransferase
MCALTSDGHDAPIGCVRIDPSGSRSTRLVTIGPIARSSLSGNVGAMTATLASPVERSDAVCLGDGAEGRLRPIRPSDAVGLVAFHGRLSEHSKFLRYFYPHCELGPDEVRHLTKVDGRDRMALVVEYEGARIAVGRYDRLDDPTVAEVAFVVADRFQHHGIAPLLLGRLAELARAAGVTHFTAEVLAENTAMLHVFYGSGFPTTAKSEWGTRELMMSITAEAGSDATPQ